MICDWLNGEFQNNVKVFFLQSRHIIPSVICTTAREKRHRKIINKWKTFVSRIERHSRPLLKTLCERHNYMKSFHYAPGAGCLRTLQSKEASLIWETLSVFSAEILITLQSPSWKAIFACYLFPILLKFTHFVIDTSRLQHHSYINKLLELA